MLPKTNRLFYSKCFFKYYKALYNVQIKSLLKKATQFNYNIN